MKLNVIVTAAALAFGASAFAQSGGGAPGASEAVADKLSSPAGARTKSDMTTATDPQVMGATKKRHAKAKKSKSTQSMGAGPTSYSTDLESSDRKARMDAAYANFQAQGRK